MTDTGGIYREKGPPWVRRSFRYLLEVNNVAKEWAKAFYKSKPWRLLRAEVLRRDLFTCEECGGRATEVHHGIELTPQNINDPTIALNPELLHSLCHDCHTAITMKTADCDMGFYFDEAGQLTPRGE